MKLEAALALKVDGAKVNEGAEGAAPKVKLDAGAGAGLASGTGEAPNEGAGAAKAEL